MRYCRRILWWHSSQCCINREHLGACCMSCPVRSLIKVITTKGDQHRRHSWERETSWRLVSRAKKRMAVRRSNQLHRCVNHTSMVRRHLWWVCQGRAHSIQMIQEGRLWEGKYWFRCCKAKIWLDRRPSCFKRSREKHQRNRPKLFRTTGWRHLKRVKGKFRLRTGWMSWRRLRVDPRYRKSSSLKSKAAKRRK